MKTREPEALLAAADPVVPERLEALDLAALEPELLADIDGEQSAPAPSGPPAPGAGWLRRPPRLVLVLGTVALALAVAIVFFLAGGSSEQPSRAYGAELVRFAESSPLLLLEGPGWRVEDVYEDEGGEGSIAFVTGKPITPRPITVTGNLEEGQVAHGIAPPAVRQRTVELRWSRGDLAEALESSHQAPQAHPGDWTTAPVLGTVAQVDTRTEVFENQGGPGDREMVALWSEGGYVLELRAAVPDLAGLEERLGWLRKVGSAAWLDAMPASVVKAGAEHAAAVTEMLRGIPLPRDFERSLIPDAGLTTNRDQVAGAVTSTVACLWFRQWGDARREGDAAVAAQAERVMATSERWPVLRRQAAEPGAGRPMIWTLAEEMPSGVWVQHGHPHPLLPKAEALGCARLGLPLLASKQKRQDERGVPRP